MKNSLTIFLLLLFTQISFGETLKVYKSGVCTTYENPFSENVTIEGIFTSDSISLSGPVNNTVIDALKKAIRNTTNKTSYISLIDFTEAVFDDSEEINLTELCDKQSGMKEFRFPKNGLPRRCSLKSTFRDCTQLMEIKNLDKIDSISTLSRTFEDCFVLESIKFSDTPKVLRSSGSFEGAFFKCRKLKEIKNFDSFVINQDMSRAFYCCNNLTSIKLGTVDGTASPSFYATFEECPAIVYFDHSTSVIPQAWENMSPIFIYPISSCSFSSTITDEKKYYSMSHEPKFTYAPDTIFKIGETFETAQVIKFENITKDDLKSKLWVGVKNESMEDYCYSEPTPIVFREKETMVSFSYYGSVIECALDTMPLVIKNKASVWDRFDTMKVSGIIDDIYLTQLTNFFKAKNKFKVVDLSEAIIQTDSLDLNNLFSNGHNRYELKEFIFPNTIVSCPCDLTRAFYNCQYLKSVKNLDKLASITSLESTFYNAEIEELTFSEIPDTNSVSLNGTFKYCSSLKTINNLDRFSNITSLESAFWSCACAHLSFSTLPNNNPLNLNNTFRFCSQLKSLDLRPFSNIEYIGNTFRGCRSLDTLRLSFNIEKTREVHDKDGYTHRSGEFFEECSPNVLIYLPDSVKSIESTYGMTHYVLPITNTYVKLASAESFECQKLPYYVATQDTAWRCTLHSGDTIVKKLSDDLLSQSVLISCGLKNDAMNDYCWTTPIYIQKIDGPHVSVQRALQRIYWQDTFSYAETYPLDSITEDNLKDVYSIQLHGKYNDSTLSIVKSALKENTALHLCDFSDTELNISLAMEDFFYGKEQLIRVTFPTGENSQPISLKSTFEGTPLLKKLDLSYFANITNMNLALSGCGADTVVFSTQENNNEVSFTGAFSGTSIDSLDLSSFSKISDLTHTFFGSTVRSLKFSDKENNLSVSMFQTFCGTDFYTNEIVNFDKFTNVNNYIGTFQQANNLFNKDTYLDTLRFGTDPNKIQTDSLTWTLAMAARIGVKYLPDGVDTLPSKWRNYHDFVVPMAADTTNWSPRSLLENILNMPEISPSYAYIADTTRYLVLMDVLKDWLAAFGFSTTSLRAGKSDEAEYILFDPETMDLEDYKEYALTCVVSNPKHKALAYAVSVEEILKSGAPSAIATKSNTHNINVSEKDGIITISSEGNHIIEIFNILGNSLFNGNTNGKELNIPLPSGLYLILSDGVLLKKSIIE